MAAPGWTPRAASADEQPSWPKSGICRSWLRGRLQGREDFDHSDLKQILKGHGRELGGISLDAGDVGQQHLSECPDLGLWGMAG